MQEKSKNHLKPGNVFCQYFCLLPSLPIFFFFFILGLHLQHKEVPILGIKLDLKLPAYTTVTATQDSNHVCDLHHSS